MPLPEKPDEGRVTLGSQSPSQELSAQSPGEQDYELRRERVAEINDLPDAPLWDWPTLQDAAREAGYALLLHGSLLRDVDVIAVPWREDHDEDRLVRAFHDYPGVIAHDEEDWRGWRTFTALFGGARYFDVKIARVR